MDIPFFETFNGSQWMNGQPDFQHDIDNQVAYREIGVFSRP
jgi:hypothetical protein